ncbi:MAG TPA: ATP-binding protein [Lacunisphaera sp.]|jgi:signal transduction histidine kinase
MKKKIQSPRRVRSKSKRKAPRPAAPSKPKSNATGKPQSGVRIPKKSFSVSAEKFEQLRENLREVRETLEAIRTGEVDAVVVSGKNGNQIYSIAGAEQPYRIYLEQMQEGAVTVAADGMILYCNLRFAEMARCPLKKVFSSNLTNHLSSAVWNEISNVFQRPGEIIKQIAELRNDCTPPLPVNLTASLLPADGQGMMCLIVTDLTAQKKMEDFRLSKELAENASVAKDNFIAALSHELRTPLAPTLMVATALEKDPTLPERIHRDIALIRRNVELEARLIDDLLDLTRISHGKLSLQKTDADLHHVVNCAVEVCLPDVRVKNLQLKVELNAHDVNVHADVVRLQQAFWNVLRNAVKFTREHGIISITSGTTGENKIWVRIADSGIGFTPESGPSLFQAFEQGGSAVTRQYGGLGLGLAITKSIVDAHSGSISAESAGPGKGATFTLEFPLASVDRPKSAVSTPVAAVTARSSKIRILLVEDHKDTRVSIQRLLEIAGHKVLPAASATQALEIAAANEIDLVVSDLGLPDLTGHELMKQLRAVHGLSGIALSGYGMEEDVERSLLAGFQNHLTKPVSFEQLKDLIAGFARQKT